MTTLRRALIAVSCLTLTSAVASAQESRQPANALTQPLTDSTLAAAQFRLADRAALGAPVARADEGKAAHGAPNPNLPREGSRAGRTWKGVGIGALIGGAGGYLLFSGKDDEEDDVISAIHEGVALEGAILGAGIGAIIGGLAAFLTYKP